MLLLITVWYQKIKMFINWGYIKNKPNTRNRLISSKPDTRPTLERIKRFSAGLHCQAQKWRWTELDGGRGGGYLACCPVFSGLTRSVKRALD